MNMMLIDRDHISILFYSSQHQREAEEMNFSPFGGPFSASIPGIHQFAASQALGSVNNHNVCKRQRNYLENLIRFMIYLLILFT